MALKAPSISSCTHKLIIHKPTNFHQGSENLKAVCANTPVLALTSQLVYLTDGFCRHEEQVALVRPHTPQAGSRDLRLPGQPKLLLFFSFPDGTVA